MVVTLNKSWTVRTKSVGVGMFICRFILWFSKAAEVRKVIRGLEEVKGFPKKLLAFTL